MFFSDYADMCHAHLSRIFQRLNCCLFHVSKTFHALNLMMEAGQIRVEDGMFQKCTANK